MSSAKAKRRAVLNAPSPPVRDLGDKVHVRSGRSLRRLMVVSQRQATNGRPELVSYEWQDRTPVHPGLCNDCGRLETSATHLTTCGG